MARRQDIAKAIGEHALRSALRNGVLVQPWRGVVMDGRRALNLVTRATAGLLASGPTAVLSRNTAASLHGCSAAECADVHVTTPYTSSVRSKPGLVVHRDRFSDDDVEYRHGLPLLSLPATLTELLCVETRWVALACLDQALAGLTDAEGRDLVADIANRLAVRDDRRGVSTGEALLRLATGKSESPQESRLRLLVVDAGFPLPTPQYEITTMDGRLLYVLDLAWPEVRVGLEYDGYEAHEDRATYDAERDRRMADRGWITVRVRKDAFADPAVILEQLREAFRRRGRDVELRQPPTRLRDRRTRRPGQQTR